MIQKKQRIAIIHDALVVSGGAERLTIALCEAFPDAEIFTSVYLPESTFDYFRNKKIHTLPGARFVTNERQFKRLILLWIWGFRHINLSKFNIIITSSTYAAKYVKVPKKSRHICYLHSPFRYIWKRESYTPESLPLSHYLLKFTDLCIPILKNLDGYFTQKINLIMTNSFNMANHIQEIYKRNAEVIYPPIKFSEFFSQKERENFYLFVGRLISYKRADLAIEACEKSGRKLLIVGDGPERNSLQKKAKESTIFLGNVSDCELKELYSKARGLIFPGVEDFGIVPVEAQASGCPIIAFQEGGALESVVEGKTGVFFNLPTVSQLVETLDRFDKIDFKENEIRNNAARFDISIFTQKIRSFVERQ
ncbi:MAG: glycosyltransferase family 4 protein [Pelolinea sp.]|jgi:glycosyltransferase involved in cell wall biosynthesis|nr:glycosyltransferase family 4 protein [Pelolinea sp.]